MSEPSKGMSEEELEVRIVRFMNGAPRTWDEILAAMAGVSSPDRFDVSEEEAMRLHWARCALWQMVKDGRLVRHPSDDGNPSYDTYGPKR